MGAVISFYDLTGIQRYIFGSNTLRENLGGSWLVKQALDAWLEQACEGPDQFCWSGGGNAMLRSACIETARKTATRISQRLHRDAPGLELVCTHETDGEDFHAIYRRALNNLAKAKAERWPAAFFDGGGVTAACQATGEPAVAPGVGPTARARLGVAEEAEENLRVPLETLSLRDQTYRLTWTQDTDRLGRTPGERSIVGVVHFDGNGMGRRFQEAARQGETTLRELSVQVRQAGERTFQATMDWVGRHLVRIADPEMGGFDLFPHERLEGYRCFPVRPLVYGGDDMTLLCDGRLALDLGAELLENWQRETASLQPGGPAHACVGVALVKSHYPFFRAYLLAEECCRLAKTWLREEHVDASGLDWVMVAGGGVESVAQRRADYSRTGDGDKLHARPYLLGGGPAWAHRDWHWFRNKLLDALQADHGFHTQAKKLAAVLHQGPEATRVHLQRWRDRFGKELPQPPASAMPTGFVRGETPYLDAVELLDRVLPRACFQAPEDSP